MDDRQIVALFWQRQEDAITQTRIKYGGLCRAVARNILHSEEDAEECENDALLRLWNAIPPEKPEKLGAFTARIVRNLALNRYEAAHAQKREGVTVLLDELGEVISGGENAESAALRRELGDSIDRFLRQQSKTARVVFLRRYFLSEPIADTARSLGMREGTVKSTLSRTRAALRQYLRKEGLLE